MTKGMIRRRHGFRYIDEILSTKGRQKPLMDEKEKQTNKQKRSRTKKGRVKKTLLKILTE